MWTFDPMNANELIPTTAAAATAEEEEEEDADEEAEKAMPPVTRGMRSLLLALFDEHAGAQPPALLPPFSASAAVTT